MIIRNEQDRKEAIEELAVLNLKKPWRVDIEPFKPNRSNAQNSLYRLWLRVIAEHTGHDVDELHAELASRYLDSIVVEREGITYLVVKSTSNLNVIEFTEYLNQIERFAHTLSPDSEKPFRLPDPKDLYYEAMGKDLRLYEKTTKKEST